MTPQEMIAGQRDAHAVTRTAYINSEVRFPEYSDEPVIVMPSGDAYVRTYITRENVRMRAGMRRIGVVARVGNQFELRLERERCQGKAAKREQKRARQQRRRVQQLAGTSSADTVRA